MHLRDLMASPVGLMLFFSFLFQPVCAAPHVVHPAVTGGDHVADELKISVVCPAVGTDDVRNSCAAPGMRPAKCDFLTPETAKISRAPSGSVGIGTTAPVNKLDVSGGEAIGSYAGTNAAPTNGLIASGAVALGTSTTQSGYELTASGGIYGTQSSSSYYAVAGLNSAASGAAYGGYFSSATTGTGYGVYATIGGAANTGYAGYFSNTSTGGYAIYANGTMGAALVSGASSPATGTVAVTGGGTGLTSGTSGGIPYFSGSTSMASSAALTQYGVVYGGGAGGAPAATAAGTTGQVLVANTGAAPTWGTSSTALSSITTATGSNTINNGANAQVWQWNSLGTGTAFTLSSSSMTTGTLLSLQDTAVAGTSTGEVLSISDTTTGAGYGVYSAMTGLANTGYAGYFTDTGTGAVNYALYASTSSSTGFAVYSAAGTNYFAGSVGVSLYVPGFRGVPAITVLA